MLSILILVNFAAVSFAQDEAGKKVGSVEVQLKIEGNIYQGLQERIEYSVNRVGEKLLISQPVSLLENNKSAVRQTIINVFSKVLVGFRTESVDLNLGEYTKIVIQLTPVEPFINKIDLDLAMDGVAPEILGLMKGTSTKIENQLNQIFVGLPVASITWAESIVNQVTEYLVERDFPGFTTRIAVTPGVNCRFKLELTPQKPLVTDLAVQYASPTFPAWVVYWKSQKYQHHLGILKGLPVEFLTHYQPQIEQYLVDDWNQISEMTQVGWQPGVSLVSGVTTQVNLTLRSLYFQTKLETRYFKGEDDVFVNLQGYLGCKVDDAEIYTRIYSGQNPDGRYKIGFKAPLAHNLNFYGGYEYDLKEHFKNFKFSYRFERGDYLELDLGLEGSLNKALMGFYINPHFNLEIANYDKKYGLQIMYHFW